MKYFYLLLQAQLLIKFLWRFLIASRGNIYNYVITSNFPPPLREQDCKILLRDRSCYILLLNKSYYNEYHYSFQLNYLLNRLPLRISEGFFLQYLMKCFYIFTYSSPNPSKTTNEAITFPDCIYTPFIFSKFQYQVLSHVTIWRINEVSLRIQFFSV